MCKRALTWPCSLVLEEGVLPDEATEAGLLGVSFFAGRGLSMPFSGGECAGLPRGVAGSYANKDPNKRAKTIPQVRISA